VALKSNDISWFQPLWRRVAVAVFLVIWCAWEWFWNQEPFWGVLVGAALAYFLYNYFYAFPKQEPGNEPEQSTRPPDGQDGPGA
jgi:hypothetical protein